MNVFERVAKLFQSVEESTAFANALAKAYADGVGHPEYYTPFGADKPEDVAMNLAGLYAVDTTAAMIATLRYNEGLTEKTYVKSLEAIATGELNNDFIFIARNAANLAWRAGQPFRGITNSPLNRITRPVNTPFVLLPNNEVAKDDSQLQAAATQLLAIFEDECLV